MAEHPSVERRARFLALRILNETLSILEEPGTMLGGSYAIENVDIFNAWAEGRRQGTTMCAAILRAQKAALEGDPLHWNKKPL